jgi:hypothetical protein
MVAPGWFDTAEPRLEGDTAEACLEGETAEPCLEGLTLARHLISV